MRKRNATQKRQSKRVRCIARIIVTPEKFEQSEIHASLRYVQRVNAESLRQALIFDLRIAQAIRDLLAPVPKSAANA